jgi:hypothetical protein
MARKPPCKFLNQTNRTPKKHYNFTLIVVAYHWSSCMHMTKTLINWGTCNRSSINDPESKKIGPLNIVGWISPPSYQQPISFAIHKIKRTLEIYHIPIFWIITKWVQIYTTHFHSFHKVTNKSVSSLRKLDELMDYFQHKHNANEAHATSTSHNHSRVGFVVKMAWKSSFIFTTMCLYSSKIFLVGDNIEIHIVFTLHHNLFPFVSNNSASLHYSKCFLGEEEKYIYVECKNPSIFCTRGYLENICTIRLVCCVT